MEPEASLRGWREREKFEKPGLAEMVGRASSEFHTDQKVLEKS